MTVSVFQFYERVPGAQEVWLLAMSLESLLWGAGVMLAFLGGYSAYDKASGTLRPELLRAVKAGAGQLLAQSWGDLWEDHPHTVYVHAGLDIFG